MTFDMHFSEIYIYICGMKIRKGNRKEIDTTKIIAFISFFKVVYPKTDQQRVRLNEAVKNILLFKNLEHVSYVIYLELCIFIFHVAKPKVAKRSCM